MASTTLLKGGDTTKMKTAEFAQKITTYCVVFEEINDEQDKDILIVPDKEHCTVSLKHSKRQRPELFCFDGVFKLPENDVETSISCNQLENSFRSLLSGIVTGCLNGEQRIIHVISSCNASRLTISRILYKLMEEIFQRKKTTTIITFCRKDMNDNKCQEGQQQQQYNQGLNEIKTSPFDQGEASQGVIVQTLEEAAKMLDTLAEVDMGRSEQIQQETQILFSSSRSKKKGMLRYFESQVSGEGGIAEAGKIKVMQSLKNGKQESKCSSTTVVFACDAKNEKDEDAALEFLRFSREMQCDIEGDARIKSQDEANDKSFDDLLAQNQFISEQTIAFCRSKLSSSEFKQLFSEINSIEKTVLEVSSKKRTTSKETQQNTNDTNDLLATPQIDFRVNFLQEELNKVTAKYQSLAESVLKQESIVEMQKKDQQIASLKAQLAKSESKQLSYKEKLKKYKEKQIDSSKTQQILQVLYDDQEKHIEEVDDDVQTQRSQMNMLYQQFSDDEDEEAEIWRKRNEKYEKTTTDRKVSGEETDYQQIRKVSGQKNRNEESPEIRQFRNKSYQESSIDPKQQIFGMKNVTSIQQFNSPQLGSLNQSNLNQQQVLHHKVPRIGSEMDLRKQRSFEMMNLQLNNSQELQQQLHNQSTNTVFAKKYNPLRQSLQHQPSSYSNSSKQTLEDALHQRDALRIEVNEKYPQQHENKQTSILSKIFSTTNSSDSPKRSKQPSPVNQISQTLPSWRNKTLSNSYFKESAMPQLNTAESADTNTGSTMATMPNSQYPMRSALTKTDFVRSAIPTLSPFVNSFSYKLLNHNHNNSQQN